MTNASLTLYTHPQPALPITAGCSSQQARWSPPCWPRPWVGSYADAMNALEMALRPGPYICGDQFTTADVYVGAQLSWGLMFGTIDKRPAFEAYAQRVTSRPAALRANEINARKMAGG